MGLPFVERAKLSVKYSARHDLGFQLEFLVIWKEVFLDELHQLRNYWDSWTNDLFPPFHPTKVDVVEKECEEFNPILVVSDGHVME